mgnify:CR=1 FL=1
MMDPELRGHILAITNRNLCSRPFEEQVRRICCFHPAALILREKDLPDAEYGELAKEVMKICREYQVPFIPHSFMETARQLGADKIHLPLWRLREASGTGLLDGFKTIGVSVHSVEEALEAAALGASYLTAGHIYATDCKKGAPPRGLAFLEEVCRAVDIPVWAIGGIGLDGGQLTEVKARGAAGACVMSGMMRV